MKDNKIRCSVNGVLRGGAAVCGRVTVGGKFCSLKKGECNLQEGVKEGIANGKLACTNTEN